MRCHHCPDRVFEKKEELQAHAAKHASIQQTLVRPGGRTYGARMGGGNTTTKSASASASGSQSQPSILPCFSVGGASLASVSLVNGSPVTHANANASVTASIQSGAPTSRRDTAHDSSEGGDETGVDMDHLRSLAELIQHDDSYLTFRQFSTLNVENLLWMQAELAELEQRLADTRTNNVTTNEERAELRSDIRVKLEQYNDALLRYSQVCNLDKPDKTSVSDIRRWIADFSNNDKTRNSSRLSQALGSDDRDHVALARRRAQRTWAWKLTEEALWRFLARRAPSGKVVTLPHNNRTLHVWDDALVRMAMHGALTLILSLTLLVPLLVLAFVEDRRLVVAVTVAGSILLAVVLASLTECRNHEVIVAVSAYAAVLMVYTQA